MGLTTVSTPVQDSILSYKGSANVNALSRLPLQSRDTKRQPETDIFTVQQIEALPITSAHLKRVTGCEPILSKVLRYTKQGWPDEVEKTLKPYLARHRLKDRRNDKVLREMSSCTEFSTCSPCILGVGHHICGKGYV